MELLDRYLQAVRFWLPRAQQDDIIEELRDDLRSQIEDKESALGRTISEDELVALLQQAGHPMRVAARFLPQQSLIGPLLFPLYKFVMKLVVFGYLGPWLLVWFALMLFWPSYRAEHSGLRMLGDWTAFWHLAFAFFATITVAFALMDRFQARISWLHKWDPRKLPRVVDRKKQRVSRVESVFGLVFSIAFVVWWLALPRWGYLVFGPLGGALYLNPALRVYYLPVLVPTAVVILQQCFNLFQPRWTWLRSAALLIANAISLGIVESVAKVYPYVLLSGNAKDKVPDAQVLFIVNQVILWSLIGVVVGICIAVIVHAFQTVQAVRRWVENRRSRGPVQISQLL